MVKSYCRRSLYEQINVFATTVYSKHSLFLLSQVKYIRVAKHSFMDGTPSTLGNFNSTAILVTHHDSSHSSWQKFVLPLEKCCQAIICGL